MTRVPVDVVLTMLRQSGRRLTPAGLRNWTRRGLITHTEDGYDLDEVADAHEKIRIRRVGGRKLTSGAEDDTLSPREACPDSGDAPPWVSGQ